MNKFGRGGYLVIFIDFELADQPTIVKLRGLRLIGVITANTLAPDALDRFWTAGRLLAAVLSHFGRVRFLVILIVFGLAAQVTNFQA